MLAPLAVSIVIGSIVGVTAAFLLLFFGTWENL